MTRVVVSTCQCEEERGVEMHDYDRLWTLVIGSGPTFGFTIPLSRSKFTQQIAILLISIFIHGENYTLPSISPYLVHGLLSGQCWMPQL